MALETPSRPPPFMANAILNFHFDYLTPSLMWKMIREQNNPTNDHSAIWHLTINQIAIAGLQISIKIPKINHRLGSDQSKLVFTLSSPALHISIWYFQSHWIYCKIKICIFQNPKLYLLFHLYFSIGFFEPHCIGC